MADNKRNSIAGKAATPKPAANANANANSTSNDSDGSLSKAIGARIRITYNGQRTVEGTLYTADTQTNLVAVNTSTSTADTNPLLPGDFVIIPISSIESFQLLSLASTATTDGPASAPAPPAVPTLSKADYAALKAREETAIKEMKERDASRGKGVSKEGQEIFDHFKRTLPTRWHDATIVINDSILLEPPYRAENIRAPAQKQAQIPQIKRVLEGYHSKKRSQTPPIGGSAQNQSQGQGQSAGQRNTVTPIPPRKGG